MDCKPLKYYINKKWTVVACSDNEVYYLILKNNKYRWESDIDFGDILLFDTKEEINSLISHYRITNFYPINCNAFEAMKIIPSVNEDCEPLYEVLESFRINIKNKGNTHGN